MLTVILMGTILLIIGFFYLRIRSLTKMVPASNRKKRYLRSATAHEREQWHKLDKKARRTRNPKKKIRLLDESATWRKREESSYQEALRYIRGDSKAQAHGIRRAETTRGIHPKKEGRIK